LTARGGGRFTQYTDSTDDDRTTFTGESLTRTYGEAGVSLVGPSFSRIYDATIGPFGKFKHVIEPRADYEYVSDVDDPLRIPIFDEVDSALGRNQVRYAIVNRLLARRAESKAGGATEIAAHAREVLIVMKASPRSFVKALDFQTSGGHFAGRSQSGARGAGPAVIVTDVGILKPHPETGEFALSAVYPGIPAEEAKAAVGWPLAILPRLETCAEPTAPELAVLRALEARTEAAHREPVRLPL